MELSPRVLEISVFTTDFSLAFHTCTIHHLPCVTKKKIKLVSGFFHISHVSFVILVTLPYFHSILPLISSPFHSTSSQPNSRKIRSFPIGLTFLCIWKFGQCNDEMFVLLDWSCACPCHFPGENLRFSQSGND